MRWLTNMDAEGTKSKGMCEQVYGPHTWQWLRGKVIGEPKATEPYSAQELKDMGMVGVYEEGDEMSDV